MNPYSAIPLGWQIRVPLPFPLKWVNSYLITGDDGYTLIDPGLHTEEAASFWHEVLQNLSVQFSQIEKIVLTHYHPDHYGLAGWFQDQTNAPVFISAKGYEQVIRMWGECRDNSKKLVQLFKAHGMDEVTASLIYENSEGFVKLVSPQPEVTLLELDQEVRIGNLNYKMIETGGHAEGHLCFYHPQEGIIFCGDHVLPKITPNISLMPGADPNPLHSFLQSLEQLNELDVIQAYPGHREPFTEFSDRISYLIGHHLKRLQDMKQQLMTAGTAYELCRDYFGTGLSVHQLRFAMAETLAHLVYLEQCGDIEKYAQDSTFYFRINL